MLRLQTSYSSPGVLLEPLTVRYHVIARCMQAGALVQGTVRSLQPYGAFVDLTSGQTGLLHIKNFSAERVDDMTKVLKLGQRVKVRTERVWHHGAGALTGSGKHGNGQTSSGPHSQ